MQYALIKLSLFINYFVFAILLNSVGTVILQVQQLWRDRVRRQRARGVQGPADRRSRPSSSHRSSRVSATSAAC
ncbi:MAG: hypothetical protein U5K38_10695 [Woeseiaceae bacterium]|nr:hypothetical protein [Woeseiaceae bacterium]